MDNSTIAAIATPGGRGGIGIIKISGPEAASIAAAIFQPALNASPRNPDETRLMGERFSVGLQSHRLHYGHIIDPRDRRVLDEVLLSIMKAPRSYTTEDVVEINVHGGQVAVHAILDLVLSRGARLAEPGEFTKRAFLNGRIDLTQAEAVIDIINARSDKSLQIAAAQVSGNLKRRLNSIRQRLIGLLTRVEATIDFPDDVAEIVDPPATVEEIESHVVGALEELIQHHKDGNVLRDGLKIAVVGRPNVGKSSLLNRLVQKDRAIVTEWPGTTRDTIEETLNIQGWPVILSDTAGLHDTNDPIETIGIEKTLQNLNGADLVLFLVEANCPLTAADHKIFEHVRVKPAIIVINKIDLVNGDKLVRLPGSWAPYACVQISALYDRGIDRLKQKIIDLAFGKNPIDIHEGIVPNLRHARLLQSSLEAAEGVVRGLASGLPMDLIAIDLQHAIDLLGQILGTDVKVDVLEEIFSRFCIGK